MCFYTTNFCLPWPFRSLVRSRHATNRRTDRHRPPLIMPPTYGGRRHNKSRSSERTFLSSVSILSGSSSALLPDDWPYSLDNIAERLYVTCTGMPPYVGCWPPSSPATGAGSGGWCWDLYIGSCWSGTGPELPCASDVEDDGVTYAARSASRLNLTTTIT